MQLRAESSRRAPASLLILLACAGLLGLRAGDKPVTVRAYICTDGLRTCVQRRQVGFVPADIVIEAVVPHHKDNRRLRLGLYCPELGELNTAPSEYQIEGDTGRKLFTLPLRRVTYPCAYYAVALLDSASETRGSATTRVQVR